MSFISRRAKIKVRLPVKFPANVTSESPLNITQTGANYHFTLDMSNIWTKSENGIGIFSGSGEPTISAAKGSLYMRTDGSGVNDRAYINTDGGTTWTAISTVA